MVIRAFREVNFIHKHIYKLQPCMKKNNEHEIKRLHCDSLTDHFT